MTTTADALLGQIATTAQQLVSTEASQLDASLRAVGQLSGVPRPAAGGQPRRGLGLGLGLGPAPAFGRARSDREMVGDLRCTLPPWDGLGGVPPRLAAARSTAS